MDVVCTSLYSTFRMKHETDVGRVGSDPFCCMFEGQDLLCQEDNYIAV